MNLFDELDGSANRMNGKVGIVVEVAQKRDGEAIKPRRPSAKANLLPHELQAIGLEQNSIGGERSNSRTRCEPDEISSADTKRCQSVFEHHILEHLQCDLRLSEYAASVMSRYDDKNAFR
jgi:hypothetical protein